MAIKFKNKFLCFKKGRLFYFSIIVLLTGALLSGVLCSFFNCKSGIYSLFIKDFESCANAGFPIVASDPPRCYLSQENVFVRDPQHIRVFEPTSQAYVTSPFTIKGQARALNNEIGFELEDSQGKILKQGKIQVNSPEHGRWGSYSKEIEFSTDKARGVLRVFDVTRENEKINILSRSIIFQKPDKTSENQQEKPKQSQSLVSEILDSQNSNQQEDPLQQETANEIPQKAELEVPFTSQAPYKNWDPPYDEACEEASVIMVEYYLRGETLDLQQANKDITLMTDWEKNHGYKVDVSLENLSQIVQSYYKQNNYQTYVYKKDQVSIENIKKLITSGHPVIVPAAGQMLENPNFRGAGPPYHMLVITGFDKNHFFTNDPGTKNGRDFKYTYENLINSIHDWTGSKSTITQGEKAMMVITKP
ncbi:MAG: hypothetical protein GF335_03155 [Candidatus Moranbacteria bacterium]|nr:hypothetical protein [Candidatus Moranbacteria bacterium]